jgi:hypothetical protein
MFGIIVAHRDYGKATVITNTHYVLSAYLLCLLD